jgi:hypothetical protein
MPRMLISHLTGAIQDADFLQWSHRTLSRHRIAAIQSGISDHCVYDFDCLAVFRDNKMMPPVVEQS